jgi:hypothetical protein
MSENKEIEMIFGTKKCGVNSLGYYVTRSLSQLRSEEYPIFYHSNIGSWVPIPFGA